MCKKMILFIFLFTSIFISCVVSIILHDYNFVINDMDVNDENNVVNNVVNNEDDILKNEIKEMLSITVSPRVMFVECRGKYATMDELDSHFVKRQECEETNKRFARLHATVIEKLSERVVGKSFQITRSIVKQLDDRIVCLNVDDRNYRWERGPELFVQCTKDGIVSSVLKRSFFQST